MVSRLGSGPTGSGTDEFGTDDAPVLVARHDGVVTITLNRPRWKNAIAEEGWRALRAACASISLGDDRVVVITGAAEDFCAGADLAAPAGTGHPVELMSIVNEACLALHRMPVTTIARVDGVAVGAGVNLALACDFVIASDRARFSEIFIRRGLSVDFGGSWLLPRLVGLRRAKELVLLGEILTAEQAREIGLIGRVVAQADLDGEVGALVARLVRNPPMAAALSKRMLDDSFDITLLQALDVEARNQAINMAMDDFSEAKEAFLAKRQPVFRGR
jgi:2-(1,2-epoxy-1,2-dihydrophenyl)acetyl-CoA isomerase